MFRTRLLSGIVLVAVALIVLFVGSWLLAAVLCILSIIAYWELAHATGLIPEGKKAGGLEITGLILTVLYYVALSLCIELSEEYDTSVIFIVMAATALLSLLIFLGVYVFTFPKYKAGSVMLAYGELLYGPVLLSCLYAIRGGFAHGVYLVWLVFFCSWGCDTFAYCVGVLIGKHKMTPKLSPKKSIEGAIGGIVGSALLFGLYTHFVLNVYVSETFHITLWLALILGVVGALVSMIGDLAASGIKRDFGIKDYGKLIPGHGGIMDRFDSVIMAAPLIFLGLALIGV